MSDELKACPYCKATSVIIYDTTIMPDEITTYYASCTYCGAQGSRGHDTPEEAIAAWNTLATLREERDRAVEALNRLTLTVESLTHNKSVCDLDPDWLDDIALGQAMDEARKALGDNHEW